MGRPRKYATSEESVAAKRKRDRNRSRELSRTRINIGAEVDRWKQAKSDSGCTSDEALAKLLLDRRVEFYHIVLNKHAYLNK